MKYFTFFILTLVATMPLILCCHQTVVFNGAGFLDIGKTVKWITGGSYLRNPTGFQEECLGQNGKRLKPIESGIDCIMQNHTIFFIETNPDFKYFNGRRLCSFESTAKHNPNTTIVIWVDQDFVLPQENLLFLQAIPNIYLTRSDYKSLLKSVHQHYLLKRLTRNSSWYIPQMSNLLRVLTVFKYGGVYMDTDIVSLSEIPKDLKNFVVREDNQTHGYINTGVIHFVKAHGFLTYFLKHLVLQEGRNLDDRNSMGPRLWRDVVTAYCPEPNIATNDSRISYTCPGDFRILKKQMSLQWGPSDYAVANRIGFKNIMKGLRENFVIHYFGSNFDSGLIQLKEDSPLVQIMESHCPEAVKMVKEEMHLKEAKS